MKNKYILLSIVVLIAAAMGAFMIMNEKYVKDNKINAGIDELIRQTEIDTANKVSALDTEIKIAEETKGEAAKVIDLLIIRSDVESNRIGRVAALNAMPGIIEYNDLGDYLWNIREGRLNRSDFEGVGLTIPKEWIIYEGNINMMNNEVWAIYSKKIEKMNDMENRMK